MIHSYNIKNNIDPSLEDAMTSTVFGMLLTFPDEMIWPILFGAIADRKSLHSKFGKLLEYHFWPKWDPSETENVNYVEPDVFLRFEDCDVIVEAKRSDSPYKSPQIYNEWTREITAYHNEYGFDKKVILLSVGGNQTGRLERVCSRDSNYVCVYKISWISLLLSVTNVAESTDSSHIKRLCDIMIHGFAMHQIAIFNWLSDINFYPVSSQSMDTLSNSFFPEDKRQKKYFDFLQTETDIPESSSSTIFKFFAS